MAIGDTVCPRYAFRHSCRAPSRRPASQLRRRAVRAGNRADHLLLPHRDGSADVDFDYSGRSGKATIAVGERPRRAATSTSAATRWAKPTSSTSSSSSTRRGDLRRPQSQPPLRALDPRRGRRRRPIGVAVAAPVVLEGNGTATFTISLSEPSTDPTGGHLHDGGGLRRRRHRFHRTVRQRHHRRRRDRGECQRRPDERSVTESAEVVRPQGRDRDGLTGYGQARSARRRRPGPGDLHRGCTQVESSGYHDVDASPLRVSGPARHGHYRTVDGTADSDVDFTDSPAPSSSPPGATRRGCPGLCSGRHSRRAGRVLGLRALQSGRRRLRRTKPQPPFSQLDHRRGCRRRRSRHRRCRPGGDRRQRPGSVHRQPLRGLRRRHRGEHTPRSPARRRGPPTSRASAAS